MGISKLVKCVKLFRGAERRGILSNPGYSWAEGGAGKLQLTCHREINLVNAGFPGRLYE